MTRKNRLLEILSFAGAAIIALFFIFPIKASAAECKLTAAYWGDKTINVGDKAVLFVEGENCKNHEVSFNIYELDYTDPNDFIGTEKAKSFDDKKYTISAEHTFTIEDYARAGGESGEENFLFQAFAGNSRITSPPDLVVKKPSAAGNCVLNGADWNKSLVKLEEEVFLRVKGTGCKDFEVAFNIYEFDSIPIGSPETYINRVVGKFNSDTEAFAPYKFTKADYTRGGDEIGGEKMFFRASAGNSRISSAVKGFLDVTPDVQSAPTKVWACVDDDNTYRCSPGNKQDLSDVPACQGKTPTQIDRSLCNQKVGSGGGGGGGGSGGGQAPTSTTIAFDIKNPIGASNLIDLINIIGVWIFNLSIPVAVIMILYAGITMLTAGPNAGRFNKGAKILGYTAGGLTIIFIGKGFVSLIRSILSLRG